MKNKNALKWIMKNSKSQNKKIVVLLIANALFSALSIVFALFIKEIIDSAVGGNMQRLISFAVAIIGVVFLQFGFRIFTNLLTENIKNRLEISYKSALFSSILRKKHDNIILVVLKILLSLNPKPIFLKSSTLAFDKLSGVGNK